MTEQSVTVIWSDRRRHVARTFLEQGYNVRGTVRDDAKGEYLVNLYKDLPGRFEYVIVRDIGKVCSTLSSLYG